MTCGVQTGSKNRKIFVEILVHDQNNSYFVIVLCNVLQNYFNHFKMLLEMCTFISLFRTILKNNYHPFLFALKNT